MGEAGCCTEEKGEGQGRPGAAEGGSVASAKHSSFNWTKFFSIVFWFFLHAVVLTALFVGQTDIEHDVTSSQHGHIHAVMYFLTVLAAGLLFTYTSLVNPGWIETPVKKPETIIKESGSSVVMKSPDAVTVPEPIDPTCRFCPACNLWQKLRSKHCNLCNKCVAKYDHHCFWMGNCIGEKNHGTFWWFLFLQTILIIWSLVLLVTGLIEAPKDTVDDFLEYDLLSCLVVIMVLVVGWLPAALLGLHSYLILTNQTTWEFNRRSRITYLHGLDDGVHPFSKGGCGNIQLICCDFDPTPKYWRGIANDIGTIQN